MVDVKTIEAQLKQIGCNFRFWGRPELRELSNVLLPGERVMHCVNGVYEGGFAMLCATDQRVLLIDKKPMYLTIEDIRFDMIAEMDYNYRLLNSSLMIYTPNKVLHFTAYNQPRLRQLYIFVQNCVMEIRQHYLQQYQTAQAGAVAMQPRPGAFVSGSAGSAVSTQGFAQVGDEAVAIKTEEAATQRQMQSPGVSSLPIPGSGLAQSFDFPITAQQVGIRGMRRVVPIISAYTRLPRLYRHDIGRRLPRRAGI